MDARLDELLSGLFRAREEAEEASKPNSEAGPQSETEDVRHKEIEINLDR